MFYNYSMKRAISKCKCVEIALLCQLYISASGNRVKGVWCRKEEIRYEVSIN